MDGEVVALDPRLGGDVGEILERGDKLRTAIGIARIVERVDPDVEVPCPGCFGPAEADREEDGVPSRHVGDRDSTDLLVLRNLAVPRQRRPAEKAKIERKNDVTTCAQGARNA